MYLQKCWKTKFVWIFSRILPIFKIIARWNSGLLVTENTTSNQWMLMIERQFEWTLQLHFQHNNSGKMWLAKTRVAKTGVVEFGWQTVGSKMRVAKREVAKWGVAKCPNLNKDYFMLTASKNTLPMLKPS